MAGGALAYWEGVMIFAFLGVVLALSLNVPMGLGGIFSAAQGAHYGVGAYIGALLAIHVTGSVPLILLCSIAGAAASGCVLIIPALRTRFEYFMIASLSLQYVASTVFVTWSPLGGEDGLTGLRPGDFFGAVVSAPVGYLWLSGVLAAICVLISIGLRRSRFGRELRAIRDNEEAAKSLGVGVSRVRMLSLIIGAGMAGAAGAVYALYVGFVNPDSFDINESVLLFAMVILGGAGSVLGPVLGAILLTVLPSWLTYVNVVPQIYQGLTQQIIYGAALVLMVLFRPDGILGKGRIHVSGREQQEEPEGPPRPVTAGRQAAEGVPAGGDDYHAGS
jgi:branched-chain amino acid transport system permease protein